LKLAFIKCVAAASKKAQLFGINADADTQTNTDTQCPNIQIHLWIRHRYILCTRRVG